MKLLPLISAVRSRESFAFMTRSALFAATLGFLSPFLLAQAEREGRSFVGKQLPAIVFTDSEGHTVDTRQYLGSVLVMITGIPW